jgi:AraC-like DNA-binding protein
VISNSYDGFGIDPGSAGAFTYSGELHGHSTENLHHHAYHQILIICRGAAVLETSNKKAIHSDNTAVFLPAYIPHRSLAICNGTMYISLYLGIDALKQEYDDIRIFQISRLGKELIVRLTERQEILLNHNIEKECLLLLLKVLEEDMYGNNSGTISILPFSDDRYVMRAIHFLETNYREPIDINDLRKCSYVSYRQLARVFEKELGISPFNYLKLMRLQRAALEIINTDKNITTVAMDNGFQSMPLFFKEFKRYYGMSPSKYRTVAAASVS